MKKTFMVLVLGLVFCGITFAATAFAYGAFAFVLATFFDITMPISLWNIFITWATLVVLKIANDDIKNNI